MLRLLLVEDDELFGRALCRALKARGVATHWLRSCAETRAALAERTIDIDYALIDDLLGDGFGLDLLPLLDRVAPAPASALVSACVTEERALSAIRAGRVLLPKPAGVDQTLALLLLLEQYGSPRLAAEAVERQPQFALEGSSLHTPAGLVVLRRPIASLLSFLYSRRDRFTSGAELACTLLGRRDRAAPALVRRRVADARRLLGAHSWIIQSVPKHGYRIHPRAFAASHIVVPDGDFTHRSRTDLL